MSFKRAFVTGGAGFIGSHVVDAVLAHDASVVIYDNFSTGRREFLPKGDGVQVVEADVSDLPSLTKAMRDCDIVFHFQANADVRGGIEKNRLDLEQNTIATWNVLEAMRVNKVAQIALASSSAVYGEPDIFPTPETAPLVQTSLYGASKLAAEAMTEAYCEYYNMRCFIFRFVSWIGERYSHGVIFDFMKKLSKDPTKLFILGNGQQRKSYLYVKDGVSGIMAAVHKSTGIKNIYNLGHDEHITVVEVAKILFDELGYRNVQLEFEGSVRGWIGDSPLVHLDTSKIKNLAWKPQTNIEEGIRRTIRFLNSHSHLLSAR
jgi:UDP-glucose 4-epimerase